MVLFISLLSACSGMPGRQATHPPLQEERTGVQATPATTSIASRTETEQVSAELAVLLQQAQQELLVYHDVIVASDLVARAAVLKNKVTDYAFCQQIPSDLTRVKHYATHGAITVNFYRGRCVHHVERFVDEQKFKNRREEVLPKRKSDVLPPPSPAAKKVPPPAKKKQ